MRKSSYRDAKLKIFETHTAGLISESQRDEALAMLESKKESTELTPDRAKEVLDEFKEVFPDLEEDIEKLAKKIEKASDKDVDDDEEDEKDDSEEGEDDDEKEVSEAALELYSQIMNL